jgi:hypothetical protein
VPNQTPGRIKVPGQLNNDHYRVWISDYPAAGRQFEKKINPKMFKYKGDIEVKLSTTLHPAFGQMLDPVIKLIAA